MGENFLRPLLWGLVALSTLVGSPGVTLAQTGYLHITSEPEAAEIYITPGKKEKRGATPFKVELPAGSYTIRVVKEFYQEKAVTVQVRVDRVAKLHIKLERKTGWEESKPKEEAVARGMGTLTIITDLDGASIWIDGRPTQGKTPLTIDKVSAGRHRIKLEYEGLSIEREIVLRPNQTLKLMVEDLESRIRERRAEERRLEEARQQEQGREKQLQRAREEAERRQEKERQVVLMTRKKEAKKSFIGFWEGRTRTEVEGGGYRAVSVRIVDADDDKVRVYSKFGAEGVVWRVDDDLGSIWVKDTFTAGLEGVRYPGSSESVNPTYDRSVRIEMMSDGRLRYRSTQRDVRSGAVESLEVILNSVQGR